MMTMITKSLLVFTLRRLPLLLCLCCALMAADKSNRIKELSKHINSPDTGVRLSVIAELVKTRDPLAAKPLIELLKDQNREVRTRAATALGVLKAESAVKPLINLLKDSDPYVRAWAGAALIRIGPAAIAPLVSELDNSDPYVPALAALALSGIRDNRSESALRQALFARNSKVIFGLHTYYIRLGASGSEEALIETLQKFPNKEMAQEFFNSGNSQLASAAQEWAQKFNQHLAQPAPDRTIRWASGLPQLIASQPDIAAKAETAPPASKP